MLAALRAPPIGNHPVAPASRTPRSARKKRRNRDGQVRKSGQGPVQPSFRSRSAEYGERQGHSPGKKNGADSQKQCQGYAGQEKLDHRQMVGKRIAEISMENGHHPVQKLHIEGFVQAVQRF